MELPLPVGFVDNLLISPDGDIVVVETKLWRNYEARREVVAQVLDYARSISALTYEQLEAAVRLARRDDSSIYTIVNPGAGEAGEPRFVDAVSRRLRLGRLVLLIVGDGIREGVEQLSDYLQRNMALHFTLATVAVSVWRGTSGDTLLVPSVPMKTTLIPRGVVRMDEQPGARIAEPANAQTQTIRPQSLSEEAFYEELGANALGVPDRVRAFLARLEPLGVYPVVQRSMSLKWRAATGVEFSLGAIDVSGTFSTDYANWPADNEGILPLAISYQEELSSAPGLALRRTPKQTGWRVVEANAPKRLSISLLLDQGDAWIKAISNYIAAVDAAVQQRA
jgi:hypothetical protein